MIEDQGKKQIKAPKKKAKQSIKSSVEKDSSELLKTKICF